MTGEAPLRVVVVGAGAMGRDWVRMLGAAPQATLVGLVDLDTALAEATLESVAGEHPERPELRDVLVGASVTEVAERSGAEAVINVTVPGAHRIVNEQALRAGLPVLCEKPLAPTVAEALSQVALADITGRLLMVSQSRRYNDHLTAFRDAVVELGPLAVVDARFLHEDHEPGFREQMAHPLLLDMSIHHFDMLRYVTGEEPVSVRCSSWNPKWSWFAGDATATAEFELASGARFVYSGSRCTPGLPTSWNADWHAHGEHGAALWNGEREVLADKASDGAVAQHAVASGREGIAGSLAEFARALRTGTTPQNEVRENVRSLVLVEAAMLSSSRNGDRVVVADLLDESLSTAIVEERSDDVREALRGWSSAAAGIATPAWGSAASPAP